MKFRNKIRILIIIQLIVQIIYTTSCFANNNIPNINSETAEDKNEIITEDKNELKIYSESAILIEAETGEVLYNKEMNTKKYPASTTKILTAIIALERCDLDEIAYASYDAINSIKSGYTTANIHENEGLTIKELLDVLLIHSANEAANIIAEHIAGNVTEFAKLMNQKAKEIGCENSNFVNANGEHNDNHYSTAYDLALITKYCIKNPMFREIIMSKECSLPPIDEIPRTFKNTNSLLNANSKYYYPYCIGGKTGFTTPAKNCLISIANKNGFETIAVILHAEVTDEYLSARYVDTINLFEYGYNNFNKEDIIQNKTENEINNDNKLITGIFSNNNKDNNKKNNNDETIMLNITEIIIGVVIISIVIAYYKIRKTNIVYEKNIKDNSKSELYDFKLG